MSAVAVMPATHGSMPGGGAIAYPMSEIARKVDVGFRARRQAGSELCETGNANAASYPVATGIPIDDPGHLDAGEDLLLQMYDPGSSGAFSGVRLTGADGGPLPSLSTLRDEGYPTSTLLAAVDPEAGIGSALSAIHITRTPDSEGCVAKAVFMEGEICKRGGYTGSREYCDRNGRGGKICYGRTRRSCVSSRNFSGNTADVSCYGDAEEECVDTLESGGDVARVDCRNVAGECVRARESGGSITGVTCGGTVPSHCVRVDSLFTGDVTDVNCPHVEADECVSAPSALQHVRDGVHCGNSSANVNDPHCRKGMIVFMDLSDLSCEKEVPPPYNGGENPLCIGETTGQGTEEEYCSGPVILPHRIVGEHTIKVSLPYAQVAVAPATSPIGRYSNSDAELFIQLYGFASSPHTWPAHTELTDGRGNPLPSLEGYPSSTFSVPQEDFSGISLRRSVAATNVGCIAKATLAEGKICQSGVIGSDPRGFCKRNEYGTELRICYGRRVGCAASTALAVTPGRSSGDVMNVICYSEVDRCAISNASGRDTYSGHVKHVRCHGNTRRYCASSDSSVNGRAGNVTDVRCYDNVGRACGQSTETPVSRGISSGNVTDIHCYDGTPTGGCELDESRSGYVSADCMIRTVGDEDDDYCRSGVILLLDGSCGEDVQLYNGGDNPLCVGEKTGEGAEEYCSGPVILPEMIRGSATLSPTALSPLTTPATPATTPATPATTPAVIDFITPTVTADSVPASTEQRMMTTTSEVASGDYADGLVDTDTGCPTDPGAKSSATSSVILGVAGGAGAFIVLLLMLGVAMGSCMCCRKGCGGKGGDSANMLQDGTAYSEVTGSATMALQDRNVAGSSHCRPESTGPRILSRTIIS
ncbi:MAG: hypothetical protein OXF02_02520 [Simkaniaceae bacterium]|nr:hypothetical protein [Simkaniaceae bacterium]